MSGDEIFVLAKGRADYVMRKSAYLIFFAFAAPALQADIIFSNFGTSPNFFDPNNGSFVANGGIDNSLAFSFVIPVSHFYQLTEIDFAVSESSGDNSITATIYTDDGGVPGTAIYTTGAILNELQSTGTELFEPVTNGPILDPGATYWLSLDATVDSSVTWNNNGQGLDAEYATNIADPGDPFDWQLSGRSFEEGAFEIDANIAPVPEPATTVLFASGLAVCVLSYRRRSVKRPIPTTETF